MRTEPREAIARDSSKELTLGLLTKIFGNPEGGANPSGEPSAAEQPSGATASAEDPVISAYPNGDTSNSGVRPAMEAPPQRSREPTRSGTGSRRPEHPRMYLRPSSATVDPAVPGSTRRPQISVRPGAREPNRGLPPPKRSGSERSRAEQPSQRERPPLRERPSQRERPEASSPPGTLPPASRPKNALVVSPVSLTPEEVQLAPGTRQKMPTLVGLGAALETPPLPLVAPSLAASRAASRRARGNHGVATHGGASQSDGRLSEGTQPDGTQPDASQRGAPGSTARNGGGLLESSRAAVSNSAEDTSPTHHPQPNERPPFDALNVPIDADASNDIRARVHVLADFALKLALGPVSQAWVPHVRRSAVALLSTGQHRDETALAQLSARLLALLPNLDPVLDEPATPEAGSVDIGRTIDGEQRDQILHEVARLAGVLPEWPGPTQDVAEEARRRETRVMRELLAVVDGFKRDQRARLEDQMRLEDLAQMAASVIAEEFEAPLERAGELLLVLESYRRERRTCTPDIGNMLALGRALDALSLVSRAFDECDAERKDSQRVLRLERRQALTSVALLLAERGELELLEQLEPLSIGERVERLQQWFESVRSESVRSENSRSEDTRSESPRREPAPFERSRFEGPRLEGGPLESGSERTT